MSEKLISNGLLRVFKTVCETKGLNLAAQRLNVSPSYVSQALKKLEDTLHVTLFDHGCRPLKLTAAGRRLLLEGTPILLAAEALTESFLNTGAQNISIRLGIGESASFTVAPWLIAKLRHTVAQLETYTMLTSPLSDKLHSGSLDITLSPDPFTDLENYFRYPVYDEEFLLVTSKTCPPVRTAQDLRELAASKPYIGYTPESLIDKRIMDRFLRTHNLSPSVRFTTNQSYCLVGLISQIDGWSFIPPTNLLCGRSFAQEVNWSPVSAQDKETRRLWVVGKADRALLKVVRNETLRCFKDHVLPEIASLSKSLPGHITLYKN